MPTKKSTTKKSTATKTSTTKKPSSKTKNAPTSTKVVKPSSKKKAEKKSLTNAQPQKAFWVHNGPVLKNLVELADALQTMDEVIFTHHVTKEKNDFADWVETVLKDVECATAIRRSKKPSSARTIVVRHLKLYSL